MPWWGKVEKLLDKTWKNVESQVKLRNVEEQTARSRTTANRRKVQRTAASRKVKVETSKSIETPKPSQKPKTKQVWSTITAKALPPDPKTVGDSLAAG